MTAQLSRERLEEKLLEHIKHGGDSEEETMIRMLLAGMSSEPVAVIDKEGSPMTRAECNDDRVFAICCKVGTPLYAAPPAPVADDYFASLVTQARARADKAMRKFPQPNYVLNKVAEESGEVIKAVIHYTEGREEWRNVEGEIIDNLAMLIRLVQEGDQVIGFTPPTDCRGAMLKQTCTCPSGDGSLRWPCPDHPPEPLRTSTVPDGWKLVPVDATRAMIDAARRVEEDGYDAMHKAMLAAAPAAPEQEV